MKYQQLSSIIGVIDRVGMRNIVETNTLIIPSTILGDAYCTLPLRPKAYEIQFDNYCTPVRNPTKVFNHPFLIFTTGGKWNMRANPPGFKQLTDMCYFADELFFAQLFSKCVTKKDSDYFIVGGYRGEYNMYVSESDLQEAIISLHNRILDRVRKCAKRNRTVADSRGTYEIVPWGIYPKSVPDIQYIMTYHAMTEDDLVAYFTFIPMARSTIEHLIRMELIGIIGYLLE